MSALLPALGSGGESAASVHQPAGESGGEEQAGQAAHGATHLPGWPSFSQD